MNFTVLNLKDLQLHIDMGRLQIPKDGSPITLRNLVRSGIVSRLVFRPRVGVFSQLLCKLANALLFCYRVYDGVKLLGVGGEALTTPLNIEVTRASMSAIEAVERVGGTVVTTYYNSLALRVLVQPERFIVIPKVARPPPRLMPYYLDYRNRGSLSPEIQLQRQLSKLGLPSR